MLYAYFFNMLKVGVPGLTHAPQLLVYNLIFGSTITIDIEPKKPHRVFAAGKNSFNHFLRRHVRRKKLFSGNENAYGAEQARTVYHPLERRHNL